MQGYICTDKVIHRYKDTTGIQRYTDLEIQRNRYSDTGIQIYRVTEIKGYRDTEIQGYRDT